MKKQFVWTVSSARDNHLLKMNLEKANEVIINEPEIGLIIFPNKELADRYIKQCQISIPNE